MFVSERQVKHTYSDISWDDATIVMLCDVRGVPIFLKHEGDT